MKSALASQPSRRGKTVVVTGGAGFIGSHVVDALIGAGLCVRVIDNFETGNRTNLNPGAELIEGDISRAETIAEAFGGADCVFHLAALPRIPLSIEKPVETHMTNVVGTLNVLMAAREARVRRLIYSSSSSVYGDQGRLPFRESMRPRPLNPYALEKLIGEEYARIFHRLFGIETLSLRYFSVFGPRMAEEGAYLLVIPAFLKARREGKPLEIHGDGEQTRDFTHVRDVVRANLLAMDAPIADGRPLNIGCGAGVSVNRIAALIGGPTAHRPPRRGDMRHTLADRGEAERVLGWRPQVSLEDGLAELLQQGT